MGAIVSVNIALDIFGIILSLILTAFLAIGQKRKTRLEILFIIMLAFNIGVLLSDALTWMHEGNTQPYVYYLVRISNFWVYSFGYLILAAFSDYLITYIGLKTYISRKILNIMYAMCAVAIVLVVISQFNHMYYFYDENNVYQRSDWYWLSQVWAIALMLINAGIIIWYHKVLKIREIISLLSYGILPVLAMAIQIMVYGLTLLYIATTLSLFIIYVSIQAEQARALKQKELELAENRIAIMLSQIQPHFLYNSLSVIRQLCEEDIEQAKQAVTAFSDYLRANLDSLTRKKPIPFVEELKHVEVYLWLENKRFGERLTVEYDISARDFWIPALALQPMVENAVRYGVLKKEDGGVVRIATAENKKAWTVTVSDNGVGFLPGQKKEDGRSHIGIDNVRSRLETICHGTLDIESEPGKGTRVTITIPKQGAIK